ncbi:TRPA1 [Symbiodinium natans]|uniref:TRPA1 protein n=1 Tax=Symbiodinium natans TaxID=878477 RepID=A0A812MWS8_9DINO|nr:TRPA1 [Symbiodinium natans]
MAIDLCLPSCVAFLVLHIGVFAVHVATLVLFFRLGLQPAGTDLEESSLLVQACLLLFLQLLVSCVCTWATCRELRALSLSPARLGLLLPLAIPLLGAAQLIQPWLLWKELRQKAPAAGTTQAPASPSTSSTRRLHASGLEAVAQGAAFAAASAALLAGTTTLDVRSRLTLWLCAGLSWLSTSLALVEMDQALSDTTAACLAKCPGRTLPLHFLLRGLEVGSRLWVLLVLAALLRSDRLQISRGVPLIPVMLFADYIFTAAILFGGRTCRKLALLLALPAMAANPLKFVDVAAWSIRARKVSARLAWLRHLELLLAAGGAAAWLMGHWSSSSPRTGPIHGWGDLERFVLDQANLLPIAGAASVLLYHLFAFALARAHAEQVRADGLHRAAARGDAEAVARLLRELLPRREATAAVPSSSCRPGGCALLDGGPVNALSGAGLAPLHLAASAGADRVVRELIRANAEVSLATRDSGATPLMLSAEAGSDRVLRLLLSNGAAEALERAGPDGNTALHLAAREGHSECIHRLLRARANPQTRNARGLSAFDLARSQKPAEGDVTASQLLSTSLSEVAKETFHNSLPPKPLPEGEVVEAESPDAWPLRLPVRNLEPETPETSTRGAREGRQRHAPPRLGDAAALGAVALGPLAVGDSAERLDVPVVAAADSALDELLAEATRAGLRVSAQSQLGSGVRQRKRPAVAASAEVLTEAGTSRTSPRTQSAVAIGCKRSRGSAPAVGRVGIRADTDSRPSRALPNTARGHLTLAPATSNHRLGNRRVVICVGDSITKATVSGDWLGLLRKRFPNLRFVNAGVNGDCAYNVAAKAKAIRDCQPVAVVLLVGTNDAKAEVKASWGKHSRLYNGLPQEPSYDFFRASLASATEILAAPGRCPAPPLAVLTLPMLGEDPGHFGNKEVVPKYNRVLEEAVAAQRASGRDLELLELNAALWDRAKELRSASSAPLPPPPPVEKFMGLVWLGATLHYLLGWSWDAVGRRQGQMVMFDALHLNDAGAAVVAHLVTNWLVKHVNTGAASEELQRW